MIVSEAFTKNGYDDSAKINSFLGSFGKELKEGDQVTINYDAAKKTTTATSPSGSATVQGEDFMKATWSIWFGKIDQPKLGDQLMSKLP